MNYAYIRVSTERQDLANQRFEIDRFCEAKGIIIDKYIEEKISSTESLEKRAFGKLIKKFKKEDLLVACELSRIGRNLMQVMSILHRCMEIDMKVITIKDNFNLGNDIQSKVLAFAFGLSAEIERKLISQRTKEALARKKAEGVILGRPKGRKSSKTKLTGKEEQIKKLIKGKVSHSAIGRLLKVHRLTVATFIKEKIFE